MSSVFSKPFWNDYHKHPICLLPKRYEINHWQEALALTALITTVAMAALVILLATGVIGGGSLDVVAASIGIGAGVPFFITIFVGVGKDTTPPKQDDSDTDSENSQSESELGQNLRAKPPETPSFSQTYFAD